jgi:hypothetical protein
VPLNSTNESRTSFSASSGWLTVGGYRKDKFAYNIEPWSWLLSAVIGPPNIVQVRGVADDPGECKAALEANWQRWLDLAGLQEASIERAPGDVAWNNFSQHHGTGITLRTD